MSKQFIATVAGIISITILGYGLYFILHKDPNADLANQKSILDRQLINARAKLNQAKKTLNKMTSDLGNYFYFGISIQDQMNNSTTIVKKTNFLFTDPDGQNPEFIIKNIPAASKINQQRKDINLLLAEWQKKTDILSIRSIDVAEGEKIKQQAELIKTYMENLYQLVKSLTPQNSGLSQAQIDVYLAQIPTTDSINKILDSISTSIVIENAKKTSGDLSGITGTTPDNTNPDSGGTQNTPPITPEQVVAQQQVVAQVEQQVQIIQQQVDQIDQQIEQTIPPPAKPPVPVTPPVIQPVVNYVSGKRVIIPPTTILVQPGPPRLIQGSDEY